MKNDQLYRIPGGDGDAEFFSRPIVMKRIEADWFPNRIEKRGEALLFVVVEGKHVGEYVALTSKTLASLEGQLSTGGWASVVVHKIRNPNSSFDGSEAHADPIGMAFIEVVGNP